MAAPAADVQDLYTLIRRPRLVLDFFWAFIFVHILTTYYAVVVPTSFFWAVMAVNAAGTVIFAKQLCVTREMNDGLIIAPTQAGEDDMEMGSLFRED